jgi:hypothetical protein
MARARVGPDVASLVTGDRPIVAATLRVKAVESDIQKVVTQRMAQRLGVAAGSLPTDVKDLIATASAAASQRAIEFAVIKDLEEAVGDVSRGSVLDRFDSRVDVARKGLDHISASSDVQKIMKKRAGLLADKKKALETAGFSSQEAMDILLADIAARGQ